MVNGDGGIDSSRFAQQTLTRRLVQRRFDQRRNRRKTDAAGDEFVDGDLLGCVGPGWRRAAGLNAADEIAVGEFIAGRISFPAITALVETTLDKAAGQGLLGEPAGIDAAIAVDHIARSIALGLLPEIAVKSS